MNFKEKWRIRWVRITVVGGAIYLTSVLTLAFFIPTIILVLASTLANALMISLVRFRSRRHQRKFSHAFFLLLPISCVLIFGIGESKIRFENKMNHMEFADSLIYVSPPLSSAWVWEDLIKSSVGVDDSLQDKIEKGSEYLVEGDGVGAAEIYSAIVNQFPNAGGLRYNLGYAYQSAGRFRDAAVEYQEALSLGVEKADSYNNLGYISRRLRKWDQALQFYSESLKEFKRLGNRQAVARVYNNLGAIYQLMGLWDKAMDNYHRGGVG